MNTARNIEAARIEVTDAKCAICSRPLHDAVSSEAMIGPVCRDRHGLDIACDADTRRQANALINAIALDSENEDLRRLNSAALKDLGFVLLAERIAMRGKDEIDRAKQVKVTIEEFTLPETTIRGRKYPARQGLLVTSPKRPAALDSWRAIRGRVWARYEKANFVPLTAKRELFDLLKEHYAGLYAQGPKGVFKL